MILIKRSRDGSGYRPNFYIKYWDNGRTVERQTGIAIKGKPPASLSMKETGDPAYERSKQKALDYHETFMQELKTKGVSESLTQTLIESKTGSRIEYVRLDELFDRWYGFSRSRPVSGRRAECTRSAFRRFQDFIRSWKRPGQQRPTFLYQVTKEMAQEYVRILGGELANSTTKDHRNLLAGTFRKLLPHGFDNPFDSVRVCAAKGDSAKFHKDQVTQDELKKAYEIASRSPCKYLLPIIVCAANTGLRIGDVCLLKWTSVHLDPRDPRDSHLEVDTGKTGAKVFIPIFPDLMKELESAMAERAPDSVYVWPEAAESYLHNHKSVVILGKRLLAEAVYGETLREEAEDVVDGQPVGMMQPEKVLAAIEGSRFRAGKKLLARAVYSRFVNGSSYGEICRELGIIKSRVSTILKNIEDLTGIRIRPWARASRMKRLLKETRREHLTGKNAVSVLGWHSLRSTFCLEAISRGIPRSEVQKIVGHESFDTTMAYLHPSWKTFRDAWERNGGQTPEAPARTGCQPIEALAPASLPAIGVARLPFGGGNGSGTASPAGEVNHGGPSYPGLP